MEATQTLEQWFEQADNALPILTESARIAVVIVGVLLVLVGGRLIKTACIIGGLALGMILGGMTLAFVESGAIGVAFMVGLGLVGAITAWLMFRAWVAMAAAILFAVLSPVAVMIWQGTGGEQLAEDNQITLEQLETRYADVASELTEETRSKMQSLITQGDAQSLAQANDLLKEEGIGTVVKDARGVIFRNIEAVGQWWKDNSSNLQKTLGLAMLVGAGIGLALGLVFPNLAVTFQSAIVGAVLIVIPGRELMMNHLPQLADLIPTQPRGTLIVIGLITVAALGVQWTLYLQRVDNE